MLSDRSYMRPDYPRQTTSMLTWILAATAGASIVQFVFERLVVSGQFANLLGLSPYAISHGWAWTLVTYAFLHGGIWHLLLNVLGIYLIGREVAPLLGSRRFAWFYAGTALLSGLAWLATNAWSGNDLLVGASGCLAGLFILFACIYPEREITFLVFFVLPVTLKPKVLAWGLLAVDGLGFLFSELPGGRFATGIAHSAHLGGMLAGWLYYRYFHANNGWDRPASSPFALPKWLRRSSPPPAPPKRPAAAGRPLSTSGTLRAEVDRILDKINSQGFGALTDREKAVLDEAKDLLSRQ